MSSEMPERRTDELRRREKRIWRAALAASLLLHLLVFLAFRGDRLPRSPFAAAGPPAGDDAAAAAGGGLQALRLRIVEPRVEVIRPPAPIPTPEAPIEVEVIPEPEPTPVDLSELPGVGGTERGPEPGTGIEGGTGRGDGGTEAEGRFRVVPPVPRGLILPPSDRPGKVRGKEIAVWVFVDAAGAVVPDSTRLVPSTGDSKFDDRLKRQAAEWVFQPARKGGKAVAEWFRYVITL